MLGFAGLRVSAVSENGQLSSLGVACFAGYTFSFARNNNRVFNPYCNKRKQRGYKGMSFFPGGALDQIYEARACWARPLLFLLGNIND